MAALIVESMKQHGTNFIERCVPVSVEKNAHGKLSVHWVDSKNKKSSDVFDTVLWAIGKTEDFFCEVYDAFYFVLFLFRS